MEMFIEKIEYDNEGNACDTKIVIPEQEIWITGGQATFEELKKKIEEILSEYRI